MSRDAQNNDIQVSSGYDNVPNPMKKKLQPPSPMFDRYPKAIGTLKVYPITTPDRDEPKVSLFCLHNSISKV